jgi:hypothetical protein
LSTQWTRPPTALADAVDEYVARLHAAALRAAQEAAQRLEAVAKQNAPWTDRTGAARRGLFSVADLAGDIVSVYLSHGRDVEYGKYLETRWGERYAVIWPTLSAEADAIFRDIAEVMRDA